MVFLKIYLIAFVVFLGIDAIWLGLVAPRFYKSQIGHLMAENPNFTAAIIFYLIFIVGLVFFVIQPGIEKGQLSYVIIAGLLFGFVTYATYDLTNLATLEKWPYLVTIIDLIWGSVLSVSVSVITYLVYNLLW